MAVKGDIPWNKGLTKKTDARINYIRPTTFPKGQVPWNTGTKGKTVANTGSFRKGQKPIRWFPIGTITTRKTKDKVERQFIKISEPQTWIEYAKWLWIQKYGDLIEGDVTHHMNGNKMDDRIDNIIALPRCDHPIFHNRWGLRLLSEDQIEFYKARYIPSPGGL